MNNRGSYIFFSLGN